MRAAWYERGGPASEVFAVGDMEAPRPGPGEVLVRLRASGVNPGDLKKRADWMGLGIGYPRVIPHSDGAGAIEEVGEGVPSSRVGERVWVWGAQSGRPLGTAAEYVALPGGQAVALPGGVGFEAEACLGIPARTAHRCVFADGPVEGLSVLVAGGAGAVGGFAVSFAKWGGRGDSDRGLLRAGRARPGGRGRPRAELLHRRRRRPRRRDHGRVGRRPDSGGGIRAQPCAGHGRDHAPRHDRRVRLRRGSGTRAALLAPALQERYHPSGRQRRPDRGSERAGRGRHNGVPASRGAASTRRRTLSAGARGRGPRDGRASPHRGPSASNKISLLGGMRRA